MKRSIVFATAAVFLTVGAIARGGVGSTGTSLTAPKTVVVPEGNGRPVLLDGIFAPEEWNDALKVPIHERVELLLKTNAGHLFLGLKFQNGLGVITDLWITADGKTAYQMHSSGQLGEGVVTLPVPGAKPETMIETTIGYTKDWDANEIKADSKKRAEWQAAGRPADGYRNILFPSEGKEYQILLSKFSAPRLKMRLMAGDPQSLIIFPEKSDLRSADGWLELVLPEDGPAARPAPDEEAEKREIARVVGSVIGWAKDKNLDLFFSSIAHDEDYISVTPGDRVIKRFEDVKQNVPFWMSPDFKYVRHELKDLEIKLARSGQVAWFYCVLDDINTFKGEPASWENARWTGTVEKRDGKWVVVSQHFSFPSDR
jgi:hypothetical protein